MNIIACYKLVPEEQDIAVNADGSLDLSKAEFKISQFDLNAIEAAVELKTLATQGNITALSVGASPLENIKARKDVLSRGPDDLTVVIDESLNDEIRVTVIATGFEKKSPVTKNTVGGPASINRNNSGIIKNFSDPNEIPPWLRH